MPIPSYSYTSFDSQTLLAVGTLAEVALAVKREIMAGATGPLLTYDDATGGVVDLDLRGTRQQVLARYAPAAAAPEPPRGRGRPKLGVVAREVTLLPRHWYWLNGQPGGASVALRKLVEQAARAGTDKDRRRQAQEAAYRFMSAAAGDFPGFEEAIRALFAGDRPGFEARIAGWPGDVRAYAARLAFGGG